MEYEGDPTITEQGKIWVEQGKDKKKKVTREGKKFDSANYEKEKQLAEKSNPSKLWRMNIYWSLLMYIYAPN